MGKLRCVFLRAPFALLVADDVGDVEEGLVHHGEREVVVADLRGRDMGNHVTLNQHENQMISFHLHVVACSTHDVPVLGLVFGLHPAVIADGDVDRIEVVPGSLELALLVLRGGVVRVLVVLAHVVAGFEEVEEGVGVGGILAILDFEGFGRHGPVLAFVIGDDREAELRCVGAVAGHDGVGVGRRDDGFGTGGGRVLVVTDEGHRRVQALAEPGHVDRDRGRACGLDVAAVDVFAAVVAGGKGQKTQEPEGTHGALLCLSAVGNDADVQTWTFCIYNIAKIREKVKIVDKKLPKNIEDIDENVEMVRWETL